MTLNERTNSEWELNYIKSRVSPDKGLLQMLDKFPFPTETERYAQSYSTNNIKIEIMNIAVKTWNFRK